MYTYVYIYVSQSCFRWIPAVRSPRLSARLSLLLVSIFAGQPADGLFFFIRVDFSVSPLSFKNWFLFSLVYSYIDQKQPPKFLEQRFIAIEPHFLRSITYRSIEKLPGGLQEHARGHWQSRHLGLGRPWKTWETPIKIAGKFFVNLGKHMVGFSGVFFEICLERWGFHQDGDRIAVVYTR